MNWNAILATGAILISSTVFAQTPDGQAPTEPKKPLETTLRLGTALGVETTVSVRSVSSGVQFLTGGSGYSMGDFGLMLADGIYLSIQFAQVKNVTISNGEAVVSLSDGQQYRGSLTGVLIASDNRKYPLASLSTLEILSSPAFRDYERERRLRDRPSERPWKLQISVPQGLEFSVFDPEFAFMYFSSSGYAMGGANRMESSSSFHIKVGETEFLTNLEDFQTVSFAATADSTLASINVTTKSGVESTGLLQLKKTDDKGIHNASSWAFTGSLPNGVRIVLIDCEATLLSRGD